MKVCKSFITFLIIFALSLSAISCGGTKVPSDEFEGKISASLFETKDDAVMAYLDEQINCDGNEYCEFSSYAHKKDLSSGEISDLDLDDFMKESIISAERGKVSYIYGKEAFANEVILLETVEGYYYYTPYPKNGEALTLDYYTFLINEEKFKNVTVKSKFVVIEEDEILTRKTEIGIDLFRNEDKLKLSVVIRQSFNGGVSETTLNCYAFIEEENFVVYGVDDEGKYVDISQEFNLLFSQTFNKNMYLSNMLSSLYEVGPYLFKIDEEEIILRENEKSLIAEKFALAYYGEGARTNTITYSMKTLQERLSNVNVNVHIEDESQEKHAYFDIEKILSKYGETEFTVPEEVLALWNARQN